MKQTTLILIIVLIFAIVFFVGVMLGFINYIFERTISSLVECQV